MVHEKSSKSLKGKTGSKNNTENRFQIQSNLWECVEHYLLSTCETNNFKVLNGVVKSNN